MIRFAASWFFAFSLLLGTALMTGCEQGEDVLDTDTDGEVEEAPGTGEVDAETDTVEEE